MNNEQTSPSANYRRRNRAAWAWGIVAFVAASIFVWQVVVPSFAKGVEERTPATAESIRSAIGASACKRNVVQRMVDQGHIITNRDLFDMHEPCKLIDEQRKALAD